MYICIYLNKYVQKIKCILSQYKPLHTACGVVKTERTQAKIFKCIIHI